ncbi:MAG: hypothetical protein CM15mV145_370 [uncultured marine virus]|nr:MAG: hypothetical protein CM15mV145_370 [uncultured marine virus]
MFAELQFFKSKSAKVDGRTVPFRNFGNSLLDDPIAEFTGKKNKTEWYNMHNHK